MKRARVTLAVFCLALAAAASGWLALRASAASERGAAPLAAPAGASKVRPPEELATPASEGPPAAAERVAVGAGRQTAVLIRDAQGALVTGAKWAVFRGAVVLASGATAADGEARFALDAGGAELAVAPRGHVLQVFALDPELERQAVALAAGDVIAGAVLIDGSAPLEPLRLDLDTGQRPATAPEAVWKVFSRGTLSPTTVTDAHGRFAFGGLPPGCSATLTWSGPFNLAAEEPEDAETKMRPWKASQTALAVVAPAEQLVVQLERSPLIRGRVVAPDTGEPIPGAKVDLSWLGEPVAKGSWHGGQHTRSATAGDDGTFALSVLSGLPASVDLTVAGPLYNGSRLYTLEIPPGVSSFDAGALAIQPLRTVAFVVQDAAGAPIAGARASEFAPQGFHLSVQRRGLAGEGASTDSAGRGEIKVSPDARALRVGAAGYEPAEVPLPAGDEPLAVTLRAPAVLEVHVTGEAAGLGLQLSSPAAGAGKGETRWAPKDGIHILRDVQPGVPLTLAVVDAYGFSVLEQDVPPLELGERRIVELAPALPPGRLAGTVVSTDGQPVKWAQVSIGAVGEEDWESSMTDGRGDFCLEPLAAKRVRLCVEHKEHAPLLLPEQPVTDTPLKLVLERGRSVRVVVRGADGSPVPGAAATLGAISSRLRLRPLATPEGFVFEHAPSAALSLLVEAAGQRLERTLVSGSGPEVVDVEVRAKQTCTVHLSGRWSRAVESLTIHLEGRVQSMERPAAEGDTSVRFDVLFPGRYEASAVARIEGKEERWSATVAVEVAPEDDASAILELGAP